MSRALKKMLTIKSELCRYNRCFSSATWLSPTHSWILSTEVLANVPFFKVLRSHIRNSIGHGKSPPQSTMSISREITSRFTLIFLNSSGWEFWWSASIIQKRTNYKINIFHIEPEVAVIIPEKKEKVKPEVKVGFTDLAGWVAWRVSSYFHSSSYLILGKVRLG